MKKYHVVTAVSRGRHTNTKGYETTSATEAKMTIYLHAMEHIGHTEEFRLVDNDNYDDPITYTGLWDFVETMNLNTDYIGTFHEGHTTVQYEIRTR